jgi:Zn-dependent M16 (insulinase) family peptidase
MSSQDIKAFTDSLQSTLEVLEEVLAKWDYNAACYQMPPLMMELKNLMNWEDKEMRAMDPIVRQFINKSSIYVITKGAHGGVTLREKKREKQAAKAAKEQAKVDVLNTIDSMLAKKLASIKAANDNNTSLPDVDDMPTLVIDSVPDETA